MIALAACGDDSSTGNSVPDAGMGADASAEGPSATVFAVAGDYLMTGVASTIAIPSLEVTKNVVAGVAGPDPVVRQHGDRVYIINRFGSDNITILDAASYELIAQISTGAGSNPYDLVVRDSTVYVAAFNTPGVLVIDSTMPQEGVKETIDLSALDPDGIPNCSALHLVDTTLIVACQVLDADFAPRGPGKVVVIDTTDNTVSDTFDLTTPNPIGRLVRSAPTSPLAGDLLIGTVTYSDLTGCIERITLSPAPAAAGCLVTNEVLGGYATAYEHSSDETLQIAVTSGYDATGKSLGSVTSYDLTEGMLAPMPITPPEQRIVDLARCPTGHLVFADAAGGLRVYDQTGQELGSGLLDIGLPPYVGGIVCY